MWRLVFLLCNTIWYLKLYELVQVSCTKRAYLELWATFSTIQFWMSPRVEISLLLGSLFQCVITVGIKVFLFKPFPIFHFVFTASCFSLNTPEVMDVGSLYPSIWCLCTLKSALSVLLSRLNDYNALSFIGRTIPWLFFIWTCSSMSIYVFCAGSPELYTMLQE